MLAKCVLCNLWMVLLIYNKWAHLRIGVGLTEGGGHSAAVSAGVGETTGWWQGTGQLGIRVQGQVVVLKLNFFRTKFLTHIIF